MSSRDEWLERVAKIRQWKRGSERAPHKPLLLLYALARLQATGASAVEFSTAEPTLARLLEEFGPPRPTKPEYPFHHLQSDGLWVVETSAGNTTSSPAQLRKLGASGRLDPGFEAALRTESALAALVARLVLDGNWEDSLHDDLCAAVGLDVDALEIGAVRTRVAALRRRGPEFRAAVLMAYEYQCAMCGYDGRIATEAVGLDAAHLRWWAYGGPDEVDNALCLCSFHHKLLDRGVLGLTDDLAVAVSARFVGRSRTAVELVLRLVGRPIVRPQAGQPVPLGEHVSWHTSEAFRGPARAA